MSSTNCTTHHHACDCREAAHAAELASLRERVEDLALFAQAVMARRITVEPTGRDIVLRINDGSGRIWDRIGCGTDGLPIFTPELRAALRNATGETR